MLWKRLDVPGHDACRLEEDEGGWRLSGTAVFQENRAPTRMHYVVACDREWRTRRGFVRGWIGSRRVAVRVARTPGGWTLNGAAVAGLEDCLDLDLGFTPATNLLQLRRGALVAGASAELPVAWLDTPADALERVPQRYERRTDTTYWYESPRFGYAALLEVGPEGFIRRYPGLWEAEG